MKTRLLLLCLLITGLSCFSQTTYVPDDIFEAYLETHNASGSFVGFGTPTSMGNGIANDNYVTTDNITGVEIINVPNKNISDLTGIEDFTALTMLICYQNQLTSLDVSSNIALTGLHCGVNQLTSLDLSNNTALIHLDFQSNLLTSLNVSNNTALTILTCFSNQLSSLDVSSNTVLTELSCANNQLTSLDLSTNTALTYFSCSNNQLTSLDVRNGNNTAISAGNFNATTNPNLSCILVDDASWSTTNWTNKDATSTFLNNEAECTALSIQQNTFGSEFNVYPNPNNGVSKINFGETYSEVNLQVIDILGKVISTQNHTNTNEVILNTEDYTSGVYFVKVQSGTKLATIKLVVE